MYRKKKNYNNSLLNQSQESGNKTIPSLRVSSELYEKFLKAIEKFNSVNLVEFDITTFHRIALAYLSEQIISGEFEITFDIKK